MSLLVWLPLDGALENKGCSNITITNNGATIDNNGKIGKCYSFDGSSHYLQTDYLLPCFGFDKKYTITCWVYVTDNSDNRPIIGTGPDFSWSLYINGTAIGFVQWDAGGGHSNQVTFKTNNNVILLNTWTHIAVSWDGAKVIIYVNGVNVKENNANTSGTVRENNTGLRIGGGIYTWNVKNFVGKLNDIRIYDYCLSIAEIKEISQGLVLHYKLDDPYTESTVNLATGVIGHNYVQKNVDTYATTIQAKTTYGNKIFTYSAYIKNTSDSPLAVRFNPYDATDSSYSAFNGNFIQPGQEGRSMVTADITDTSRWNGKVILYIQNGNAGSIPTNKTFYIKEVQVEEKNHVTPFTLFSRNETMIQDSSGYGHNAVSNGSVSVTIDSDTPKYSYSTKFTAGARIATTYASSTFMPTDMLTVNIWFKSSAAANRFLSCTEGGGFNFESDSGYVRFPLYISGKGYTLCTSSTITWSALSDNKWHMITATYDKIVSKIYIDGQLDTTTNSSYPNINIGYNANTPFTLGAEAQTIASPLTGGYTGNLSDCRIYCTALSADDIKALYNVGASIDNKGKLHTFEIIEKQGNESNAKFVNNSASSVTYDEKTDTYIIVSPVGTSSWGYGVRLADTPELWVPYGKAYRWTAEVFTPIALGVQTDYNNTASTTWNGNDNDLVSARLESYNSIPANTWTKIVRGAINMNTNNTSQLPIRDYSSLGLVTNGQPDPITWKVRNLQWYVLDNTFETEIKKQGQVKSSHISEINFNKFEISKKVQSIEADELIES